MAITAKFTRTLPSPAATINGGFVFLLSAAWFTEADQGVAGSPINGINAFANGGGDMMAFSVEGLPTEQPTIQRPLDVVTFVTGGSPDAQIWVWTPSYTAGDKITLGKDDTQTAQPAVTAPFGRNAVYVNEINRMHMESTSPIDSAGNQNSIVANAVTSEAGNIGNALRFNGSSSNIDLGASILPLGDFTQNIWINPDDLVSFQGVIGNWVSPETGRSYIGLNGTSYNWDGYATSGNSRGTATALTWQMLTVTRTGSTVRILRDGVQQGATITDLGTPNVDHNTFIGALTEGTGNFYDGLIGDNFLSNTYRDNDAMASIFATQSDPDNFGTSSEYILVGGSGVFIAGLLNSNYMVEYNMKKNVAGQSVGAQMITISDGSDFTGSVSVEVTKDNGIKTTGAGSVVHEGGGYHSYAPTQAETNGDHLAFSFSGTGALSQTIQTYTSFPQSTDHTTPLATIDFTVNSILIDTDDLQNNQGNWLTADVSGLSTFDYTVDAVVASNMRGTDGANTVAPDNAGIAANGLKIDNLENISVAQIFSGGDVDTYSLEESLKLMLAANVGVLSGAATNSIIIKAADGSKARLTASVDVDGNRTSVTKDATG